MILETSAISPQIPQTEMVFSNGGGGAQDEDEEVGDEIFGQAVLCRTVRRRARPSILTASRSL